MQTLALVKDCSSLFSSTVEHLLQVFGRFHCEMKEAVGLLQMSILYF